MAELKRHISSRRGFRAHLSKLLQTLNESLSEAHSPLNEDQIATLKDLHDQLDRKQELISALDAKILKGITEDTEIEAEALQTEETNSSISNGKGQDSTTSETHYSSCGCTTANNLNLCASP